MRSLCLAPLTIAISSAVAAAQSPMVLSEITVGSEKSSLNPAVTVTSRTEIESKQADNIADVLNDNPGVNVGGSAAINSIITVHGAPDDVLNVSIDGARQEGWLFHHSGNYNIDSSLLKQVTVNAGSNSIREVDSQAGSVRFETVEAKDLLESGKSFGGFAKYQFTTNKNQNDYSVALYGRIAEQLDLLAYAHYLKGQSGKSGDGQKIGVGSEQKNALLKATWDISPEQSLSASYERYYNNALTNFRANFGYADGGEMAKYETSRDTATLAYRLNPADNPYLNLDANFYHTQTGLNPMQKLDGSSEKRSDTTVTTNGFRFENRSYLANNGFDQTISIGGEIRKTTAKKPQKNKADTQESIRQYTIYAEDAVGFNQQQFILTPALRFDRYQTQYIGLNKSFNHLSGALAGRWNINDNLGVFISGTQIYQAPPMQEIYTQPRYGYQKDLKATEGWNYQGGIEYQQNQLAGNDTLKLGATVFYTDFSHFVSLNGKQYEDLGKAKVKGVELKAAYQIENFDSRLSYSHARSKVNANGLPAYRHGDIGDTIDVNLGYAFPSIDTKINWHSRWVKGFNTSGASRGNISHFHKEGYNVHDFSLSYQPSRGYLKGLELNAGVYNLFNKNYVEHSSYLGSYGNDRALGRNYRLGFKYAF